MGFRQALEAEIPALRRYARALARDRDVADDLVQDTLLRALGAESRWRDGNLRTWLFTILTNLNRNRLRGLARRPPRAEVETIDLAHAAPAPSAEMYDILRALDQLTTEQREILLLVALEGLSYAEGAEVLGIPLGTVMSRLSRARAAFRTALGGERPASTRLRIVK
ncbi:sigma-70 family RNA polymerase sigma factor [Chelatococcus sp. SYSU_G07232]|uniref:Sigma-70 family RNA polymerase sigma factor n=1 Tax=Chelatococcus albus TaxID=3047466 RepID=A0ABT7AEE6_9HYPH|nr:sigma-70 family RNA polymerase sigma factor [Chelatococcus sp. SYSU_G07232]MDJ1157745.1 sigma-70 family RNA polymerase sigma factor [Chelatococcus sp. SYSU_G07232]